MKVAQSMHESLKMRLEVLYNLSWTIIISHWNMRRCGIQKCLVLNLKAKNLSLLKNGLFVGSVFESRWLKERWNYGHEFADECDNHDQRFASWICQVCFCQFKFQVPSQFPDSHFYPRLGQKLWAWVWEPGMFLDPLYNPLIKLPSFRNIKHFSQSIISQIKH